MTLNDTAANYAEFSGRLSDVGRQLALAALGIVWLFKVGAGPAYRVPHDLAPAAAAAVLALSLDFLQYAYAAAFWGAYNRWMEVELNKDGTREFSPRREVNWPTIACFWGKAVATMAAYAVLLRHVVPQLWG